MKSVLYKMLTKAVVALVRAMQAFFPALVTLAQGTMGGQRDKGAGLAMGEGTGKGRKSTALAAVGKDGSTHVRVSTAMVVGVGVGTRVGTLEGVAVVAVVEEAMGVHRGGTTGAQLRALVALLVLTTAVARNGAVKILTRGPTSGTGRAAARRAGTGRKMKRTTGGQGGETMKGMMTQLEIGNRERPLQTQRVCSP